MSGPYADDVRGDWRSEIRQRFNPGYLAVLAVRVLADHDIECTTDAEGTDAAVQAAAALLQALGVKPSLTSPRFRR
jgi:hypothetical protein